MKWFRTILAIILLLAVSLSLHARSDAVVQFAYGTSGERKMMTVVKGGSLVLTKYYLGDRYEFEETPVGTKERLYVGGDYYSATQVLERSGSGAWQKYLLVRDDMGSITQIYDGAGNMKAEYSYDAWVTWTFGVIDFTPKVKVGHFG